MSVGFFPIAIRADSTPTIVSSSPTHTLMSGCACISVEAAFEPSSGVSSEMPWFATILMPGPPFFRASMRPVVRGISVWAIFAALKMTTFALPPRFFLIQSSAAAPCV